LYATYVKYTESAVIVESKHMKVTHTHTHPFNDPFSGTTQVSRYQKGKTNLDFIEARDSEYMKVTVRIYSEKCCLL